MAQLTTGWTMLGQKWLGNSYGDLYVRIYARYTQQDIANNRSYVEYNASTHFGGNYIQDVSGVIGCSGTGVSWGQVGCTYVSGGEKGWITRGGWVTHGADGKLNINATAVLSFPNWGWRGEITGYASLPPIPRQANMTGAPNFTDEENPMITYSNPAGNAVTSLDACISIDGKVDDIKYRAISKTGSSYTFELTEAERTLLRNNCTTSNSRKVTFFVRTVIGGKTFYSMLDKTLTIANANPTITVDAIDTLSSSIALTGNNKSMIKGFNNIKTTVSATAKKGATIQSYLLKNGSTIFNGTTTNFVNTDTNVFEFSATDSRGNVVSKSITLSLIDYIKLTTNLNLNAPNAGGDLSFKVNGNYFNSTFGKVANALTVQYRYKENEGNYNAWTNMPVTTVGNAYNGTVNLKGLNYKNTYTFQVRAIDKIFVNGVNSPEKKVKTTPVFDWGMNDFKFNVPVNDSFNTQITNGLALPKTVDANTTLDHEIVTNINTPNNIMMYVITHFYNTKSTNANRMQVAYPYNANGSIYHRYFNGGSWTAWKRNITEEENGGDFIRIRVAGAHPEVKNDAIVPFDSISDKQGNSFTLAKNGHIRVGANVKAVRIHSSVGAKCGVNNRGWSNLMLNGAWKSQTLIYGTYLTLVIDDVLNVKEGDVITVNVAETSGVNVDGMNSYITVEKVG